MQIAITRLAAALLLALPLAPALYFAILLATGFFTVNELREVYAAVWGVEPDPRNFHRKVTSADGFVVETDETTTRGGGRPARLYRRGPSAFLHPPMLRA